MADMTHFYDKYNLPSDVVRCPYGRAAVRDALDQYAIAAVELYGLISLRDFVKIYNNFCDKDEDRTDVDELYILLLPRVLKNHHYFFYDGYICHPLFGVKEELISYILSEQAGKPRFIPPKEDFLSYGDPTENLSHKWIEAFQLLGRYILVDKNTQLKSVGDNSDLFADFLEIILLSRMIFDVDLISDFLKAHSLVFSSSESMQAFLSLVIAAHNESCCWGNKGYAPKDLHSPDRRYMDSQGLMFPEDQSSEIILHQPIQIGRNDPCICGSGRKYKQCCLKIQESNRAHLSPEDQEVFFKLWFGLLEFVARELKILATDHIEGWQHDDVMCFPIREALWDQPEIITDYLQTAHVNAEEEKILELWRDKHIKSEFFIVKHGLSGSFLTRGVGNDSETYPFYLVKGLTNSIPWSLQRHLPAFTKAVLLPFRKQIVYDGYLQSYNLDMGPNIRQQLQDGLRYVELANIFTSLE